MEGKTVIVTAAARGIGKGIAQVLAESGAKVMVTALTNRYLEPLSRDMFQSGSPIETLIADATKSDDWSRTVGIALDCWGHVDVLINNLGDAIRKPIVPAPGSYGEPMSDEEWHFILDLNLTQAFLGSRAIGPHFLERHQGKIINISGVSAKRGSSGALAYSTAKAGLVQFTQTLSLEWAEYGVTVNSIAPGAFPDPENGDPEQIAQSNERAKFQIPLGRVGRLREVGLLALYLVSDAASYMTGETIYLDGGLSQR